MFHSWLSQSKSQVPIPVDLSPPPDPGLGFREKTASFFSLHTPCHQVEGSFQQKPCPSFSPILSRHRHSANSQEKKAATH